VEQLIGFKDKVMHIERNYQLLVTRMMWVN